MLMLFLEVSMFIAGIYALVTAKLPTFVAGKNYVVEGSAARIIGLVMIAPMPIALVVGFMIGLFSRNPGTIAITIIELVLVVSAAITASLMARRMGQRIA